MYAFHVHFLDQITAEEYVARNGTTEADYSKLFARQLPQTLMTRDYGYNGVKTGKYDDAHEATVGYA